MPTVGAGFHARPGLVYGPPRLARKKWCAGCARGIWMRWVVDAGLAHCIKRGCCRSCRTDASNPARMAANGGIMLTPTHMHPP